MAIKGEFYTTVDASAFNNGIATLSISGEEDTNYPVGDLTLSLTILWGFDPDTTTGGFTGYSWYSNHQSSPMYGKGSDEEINTYLKGIYNEAGDPSSGSDAVRQKVTDILALWQDTDKINLAGDILSGVLTPGPGCFDLTI